MIKPFMNKHFLVLCAAVVFGPLAFADDIAIGVSPPNTYSAAEIDGYQFTANSAFEITALGVWGTNLNVSHDVGLWQDASTLLASTTVNPADAQIGGFTFGYLAAPILVSAGETLTIAAVMYGDPIGYFCAGGCGDGPMVVDPRIGAINAFYTSGTTLAFPVNSYPHVDWGPDFLLTDETPSPIPEPSSLLLLGSGFATLLGMACKGLVR